MRNLKSILTSSTAVASCMLLALPLAAAQAQPAADTTEAHGIETVLVTARKRVEDIREVPISISAFSADQISQHGANDLRDLENMIPNLIEAGPASNVTPLVSIRGISSDSRNIGFESGVSVYMDGVYTGRPTSYIQDLMDVDHIEVLRGPQGTLYGKNTIAGVVNIVTAKPDDDMKVVGKFEVGDFGLFREQGSVSGPLNDGTVFGAVSAYTEHRNGFQTNIIDGKKYWNENEMGGRAKLRFKPSADLDINFSVDGLVEHNRMPVTHVVSGPGALSDPWEVDIDAPVFMHRHIWGTSMNVDYSLPNGATITAITGYRRNKVDYLTDDDATPAPILTSHFTDDEGQFTQELRYSSAADDKFNYVFGAYYYNQSVDTSRISTLDVIVPVPLDVTLDASVNTVDYAAFGQANYDILDSLVLTAGLRYTSETKNLDMDLVGLPAFGIITLDTHQSKSSDAFTPMGSVLYKVSDTTNLYVTVSRGFKAGGYNADFVGNNQLSFDPEYVTNFEGGVKFRGLGGRLEVNGDAYYMDYKDLQVSVFVPLVGFVISNAAQATIKGVELDATAVPVDGLTLTTGVGYNDASFDEFRNAAGLGTNFDGNSLPYAPHWTFNFAAQYTHQLGDWGAFTIRGEYTNRGDYFSRASNAPDALVPSFDLFNARLSFETANGKWGMQLWGKNLADKLYVNDQDQPFGGLLGSRSVSYGEPRTFGADFIVKL